MEKNIASHQTHSLSLEEKESFLYGANAPYILDLFDKFQRAPEDIPADWRVFFQDLAPSMPQQDDRPPQWSSSSRQSVNTQKEPNLLQTKDSIRALMLVRVYRVRGHLRAQLDPLGLDTRQLNPELDPKTYGFGPEDAQRPIFMDGVLGFTEATLPQIMDKLQETYCGSIGVEFMHIQDPDQKAWIQARMENSDHRCRATLEQQHRLLKTLIEADAFERFLHVKFPGEKRFGLEGGESLIPALDRLVSRAADVGIQNITFGMAHRGRLSVLTHILQKPIWKLFSKFRKTGKNIELDFGSGDVKYHLGYSIDRVFGDHPIHLSLMSNPSHLEAIDPVVLGKVRAEQNRRGDEEGSQVMAVLMHGDAAFCGQGLVAETLELSGLKGYRTGGCLHIIINNQIGFTTSPPHSRSSPYSSDIAKAIQAPIFHVNGDDPEAVAWVMEMAFEFRQKFSADVVVDMICYRRHGHNEIDEPAFTQPLMYRAIAKHPTTAQIYSQHLQDAGVITAQQISEITKTYDTYLQEELDTISNPHLHDKKEEADWLKGVWNGIQTVPISQETEPQVQPITGVDSSLLKETIRTLCDVPQSFHIHPRLLRVLDQRRKMSDGSALVDWAVGEALAFGSLLSEGHFVRLSGQDVGRGTFSQRHAVWVDQETEVKYVALNTIPPGPSLPGSPLARFEVVDSPLAEASVLGFEYGYSVASPNALVLWEAQFGDFSNGAQVIIDQFISSGELKWLRLSGLVMMLPHGFEGQGPEHSSARPERYLQLCAQSNMRVANCSTPANFFHLLRRQLKGQTRKPLIVMTPKSLLRHPRAVSSLEDMTGKTTFQPVLQEISEGILRAPHKVKTVVLCSGKVYYDLLEEREKLGDDSIALIRLEQYYPFPEACLEKVLSVFTAATDFIWCQEEPQNMGAWMFLDRRLEGVLKKKGKTSAFQYCGRPPAASPATGAMERHLAEQADFIRNIFGRKL